MLSWFTVHLSCRPLDRLPYAGTPTRPACTLASVGGDDEPCALRLQLSESDPQWRYQPVTGFLAGALFGHSDFTNPVFL